MKITASKYFLDFPNHHIRVTFKRNGKINWCFYQPEEVLHFTLGENGSVSFISPHANDVHGFVEVVEKNTKPTVADQMAQGHAELAQDEQHSVPGGFAAKVTELVSNRGSDYGTPAENHQLTADLFGLWMQRRSEVHGGAVTMTAEDVCVFNVMQKLSRLAFVTKDDSWFDIAGYAENVAMLRKDQRNAQQKA
jgi:hypothetical protein